MKRGFSLPRGTSDILPSQAFLWQNLESIARHFFKLYNYKEIRTPLFEETELFVRSMGETSEVVHKQMFNLTLSESSGQEETRSHLSLRPENTASVVRSYIENRFDKKESLSKFFYIGAMFRGERPQKGRLRQFHQIGVEAIGPESACPYLDAEVIALAVNLLSALGLKNFRLKINTLGTKEDKLKFAQMLKEKLQTHLSELSEYSQDRFERSVLRILDSKDERDKMVIAAINLNHDYLSDVSRGYYQKVKHSLDILGIKYEESLNLVRGLDYYTHTVFEIVDASLGSQDALGAGGRYNNLVEELGGVSVDAVGFALGMERILLALAEGQDQAEIVEETLDIFVIALDEKALEEAFLLLQQLRQANYSADMTTKLSSLKAQMRLANKWGARYVAIIGEDELKKETLAIKNMQTGEQREVSRKDYLSYFTTMMSKR